jgi:hypothetical protein
VFAFKKCRESSVSFGDRQARLEVEQVRRFEKSSELMESPPLEMNSCQKHHSEMHQQFENHQ